MFGDFRFLACTVVHRTLMKTWITSLLTLKPQCALYLASRLVIIQKSPQSNILINLCFDDVVLYDHLASFLRTLTILNQLGVPPDSRLGSEQAQRLIQGAPNGHFSISEKIENILPSTYQWLTTKLLHVRSCRNYSRGPF